jgi:hypothetical protein
MTCSYTTGCLRQKKITFCGDISKNFFSESYILDSNLEFDTHTWRRIYTFCPYCFENELKSGSLKPPLLECKLTTSLRRW